MEGRIIAGNWKMNPRTLKEAIELARGVDEALKDLPIEKVIFPPFVFLTEVLRVVGNITLAPKTYFTRILGLSRGKYRPLCLKT